VAVGDFNGDGRLDLAVTNYDSKNVSVLLGNGDGTFGDARNSPTGSGPRSVTVGDFNGDGIPDLAIANNAGVSVLLGNGDGTFQAPRSFDAGGVGVRVAVGDFNGDGILDLAVAHLTGAESWGVSVLMGNGDGTFQAPRSFATGSSPDSVAVGDFNGDGIPDLAVANYASYTVSVLLGNGDGSFGAAVNYYLGANPFSVTVGDFNGDGYPDLVVATSYSGQPGTVSVLLGNGDGTFQVARRFAAGSYPVSVAVADVNNDGVPDLVVAGEVGVRVLVGKGDGTFQTAHFAYVTGANPYSVAVGDFNGDGFPDVAVANNGFNYYHLQEGVSILLNDSDWTGDGAPGRRHLPITQTALASAELLTEPVLELDTSAATRSPRGAIAPVGDGSRPLLRTDADETLIRAAPAESSGPQPPPTPVRARGETPPGALLDRVFSMPEPGWLWDRSTDEQWLAGP
jgi:hypothetical protein